VPDPIVVTGAASGIGRAVCERLVADGQEVIGLDLRAADAAGVTPLVCDLGDPDAIERALGRAGERLAGLVNCAGLPGTHRPDRVLAVNLLAARRLAEGLGERIAPGGAVVNVASVAALRSDRSDDDVLAVLSGSDAAALEWLAAAALDGSATYDFSKKALVALTLLHSARWLARGVRCVSVSPGPTVTPILADFEASMGADRIRASAALVGGHAQPEDVASIIAFLLGPQARWINGIDVRVDGGLLGARLAPALPVV
jgi:NAD(P)-dependent dehydrogenase (short-subunit alcohol dehydrogenase family)